MIIKVCGLTRAENIREVERLGPDMTGYILWERSSRFVPRRPAYMPATVKTGVFVNPSMEYVLEKTKELGLDRIQLHGTEPPEFCRRVYVAAGLPVIKVFSVKDETDLKACGAYLDTPGVDMFLFDTRCEGAGGSGRQFDWDVLRYYDGDRPFLLSGGIGPDDCERIRDFRHPMFAGIDINSRFETEPGVKDVTKLRNFIETIRSYEQ